MADQRRYLVIVRAGDDSRHEGWLEHPERNWDLVVSYEGRHPDRFRAEGVPRDDFKGAKWPAFSELLESGRIDWRAYDYIWLTEGVVQADGDDISRMFEICRGLDLWVAHPALTLESTFDHWITLQNLQFGLRFTSFVEPLAPVFSARYLELVLPLLTLNGSGGGFGHVWTRLVDDACRRCAVIDSVPIQVQRLREGVLRFGDPRRATVIEDAGRLLASMGMNEAFEVNIGALMRTGARYSLFDETADAFLARVTRGAIGIASDPSALGQIFMAHERVRLLGPEAVNGAPAQAAASGTSEASNESPRARVAQEPQAAVGERPLLGAQDSHTLGAFIRKDMTAPARVR